MTLPAIHDLQVLKTRLGSLCGFSTSSSHDSPPVLGLDWPGLESVLPDGGLPRGVVELASPRALGGSTSIALSAVSAGQARKGDAWCAWVDPQGSLYAPGVMASGVELRRLLVVRPSRASLGRIAVKLVGSGAFEVVVVDIHPMRPVFASFPDGPSWGSRSEIEPRKRQWPAEVLVRKLALAAESSGATVLLLTDSTRGRSAPWPVALRLDLSRPTRHELAVRIAKDRRGRTHLAKTLSFRPISRAAV